MSDPEWDVIATTVKDDVQTQDMIFDEIKKALIALRSNYNNSIYQGSFSMYK